MTNPNPYLKVPFSLNDPGTYIFQIPHLSRAPSGISLLKFTVIDELVLFLFSNGDVYHLLFRTDSESDCPYETEREGYAVNLLWDSEVRGWLVDHGFVTPEEIVAMEKAREKKNEKTREDLDRTKLKEMAERLGYLLIPFDKSSAKIDSTPKEGT